MNMEEINKTIDYYNSNADQYFSDTVNVDMTECCGRFLKYVVPGGRIIDIGAGSGRDIKYFKDKGYAVEGIDASEEMCRLATEYTGVVVRCERIQDWFPYEKYAGIWANASLLHMTEKEIRDFLCCCSRSQDDCGALFISVKKDIATGYDESGRFFTGFSEDGIKGLIADEGSYVIKEIWISDDGLKRVEHKWINIILQCGNE